MRARVALRFSFFYNEPVNGIVVKGSNYRTHILKRRFAKILAAKEQPLWYLWIDNLI